MLVATELVFVWYDEFSQSFPQINEEEFFYFNGIFRNFHLTLEICENLKSLEKEFFHCFMSIKMLDNINSFDGISKSIWQLFC